MRRLAGLLVAVSLLPSGARPAEAAESGGPPKIVFDREEHDFGVQAQEKELTTEFTYRNEGGSALTGLRALADCGCYGVTLSRTELAPGEQGTLRLDFRTLLFSGPLTKRVQVLSNDPARPVAFLKLRIEVAAGVVLDPGRLFFGDVLVGSLPSKSFLVKWKEGVGRSFRLLAVEVPGHDEEFEVSQEPYEQRPWKGTKVTLKFTKAPALGIFSATAIVRTDHDEYARLTVPLTANVSGKVWIQTRTLRFGWLRRGETRRTTVSVRPFSPDVALGRVRAAARAGRVRADLEPDAMGKSDHWTLVVSVPADAPVGKLDDVVEVRTDVPGEETTEIRVSGEVLPPAR